MSQVSFVLYLIFVASWFLHLPARYPILGNARADLLLVATILVQSLIVAREPGPQGDRRTQKVLWVLVIYIACSIPFVEWPGSVVKTGFPAFFKAFVFSYFTATVITTPKRLQYFMFVFVGCQAFRALEPLYLHLTTGYWGSQASMADWESMDRLAGAPMDVVNANGLAFIVLTVIPFLHYLTQGNVKGRLLYVCLLPLLVYTLILTASRSGMVGLLGIGLLVWWKSSHKLVLAGVFSLAAIVAVPYLSADLTDRYMSLVSGHTKNAVTVQYRVEGVQSDFTVGMRRPVFGHGLGTSKEANSNFGVHDQPSHNLYLETLEEIGGIGLLIFLVFLQTLIGGLRSVGKALRNAPNSPPLLRGLVAALQVWIGMDILFSFASYGLSSYEWYLTAGLIDVAGRLVRQVEPARVRSAVQTVPVASPSPRPLASRP